MPKRRHEISDKDLLKKIRRLEKKMDSWKKDRIACPESTATTATPSEPPNDELIISDEEDKSLSDEPKVPELDPAILQVLGANYEKPQEMGPTIHSEIAERWENILQNGLEKTEKENILKQNYYLPPENCPHLIVPKMNPETLAASSEQNKKRDALIEGRQKLISASISGLACATDKVLTAVEPPDIKLSLLGLLNNTAKILADTFYNENKTRRSLVVSGLDKEIRDTLLGTKPDKFLFGDNLHEKIKTAKSVGKTGREIRLQPKPVTKTSQSKGSQNLNWKGPPRQTPRQMPESRVNKNRSTGPQQVLAKRAPPAAARNYRKQTSSQTQHQRRN